MIDTPFFTRLPARGLIHLEGAERHNFLQGLITNDIKALEPEKMLYACLLTPQGKFLHDFFIHEGNGFTLLECEGGERAHDLFTRLNHYRLRSDVQISVEENIPVYAILPTVSSWRMTRSSNTNLRDPNLSQYDSSISIPDPRHNDMGYRSFEKPNALEEKTFEEWDKHRIALTIPDGSRDMIVEGSTMDEARIEHFNGLSYEKGCYVGQELTARIHYRGLGKKHLYPIKFKDTTYTNGQEITIGDQAIGKMRSSCGNIGLALLKDEPIKTATNLPFTLLPQNII